MTADRLTLLLRPQRWRWAGPPAPALATRRPQGWREGAPWRLPLLTPQFTLRWGRPWWAEGLGPSWRPRGRPWALRRRLTPTTSSEQYAPLKLSWSRHACRCARDR